MSDEELGNLKRDMKILFKLLWRAEPYVGSRKLRAEIREVLKWDIEGMADEDYDSLNGSVKK